MPTNETIRRLKALVEDPRAIPAERRAAKLKLEHLKRRYPELFAYSPDEPPASAQPPRRQGEILPRWVGEILTVAIVPRRQYFTYGYQIIHNRTGDALVDEPFKTFGSVDEAKEAGWKEAIDIAAKLRGRAK
jgi:hypothetical protein